MKNEEILKKLILNTDFETAKGLIENWSYEMQATVITNISFELESMVIYAFLCYIITLNINNEFYHRLVVNILINTLSFVEGAYASAFYHAKVLNGLNPNDISIKELLLFFFDIPEKLLPDKEAYKIAKEILVEMPTNIVAQKVINKLACI